jgi:outer membrane protein TolC
VARLKFVNQSIGYGERPAIDSVEAKTQLLSFQIEKENRWTEFLNAGNELSIFLWKENETPYSLPPSVIPNENWDKKFRSAQPNLNYESLMNEGVSSHPEIKMYEEQLNFYRIQRKMYFQDLLPKLDLNYRMLSNTGPQNFSVNEVRPFTENYQYSLKLDIPLRLSEGRANYRSSKLKINYGELALQQKAQSVSLKIKTYFNSYLNFEKLNRLQFENYENYSTMVRAEETRFKNGESNLFTINAREIKALEALEKMIELKTKYFKSIYEVKWSAGVLK